MGGLAAAIRLRVLGFEVAVFEKNPRIGGRIGTLEGGGFTFDTGPTLLLMTDVYRELFEYAGRRLEDYVDLLPLEPNYRVHFGDGDSMLVSRSLPEMVAELERVEPGSAPGYYRFLEDACRKYRTGRRDFVERDFERARDFFSPRNLKLLRDTQATNNYYRSVSRYFASEKLRQVFSFQTMYLGLSPFDAPAVYALLPYTELAEDGLWHPKGGMYRLVEALGALAGELGVEIHTEAPVEEVMVAKGRALGVRVNGAEVWADAVLANADLPYVYRNLLPERARRDFTVRLPERMTYTASAFMLYLGLEGRLDGLLHHNVYLSRDYRENFEAIFRDGALPEDPSFYTCVPARTDPDAAPEGRDALYVLVPVPHLDSEVDWEREREGFKQKIYAELESRAGIEGLRNRVLFEAVRTPEEWLAEYNLEKGAAFGLGHGIFQVGYFRPDIASRHIKGLYFVGASTRPGTGVPLVTIGARLTAERIRREVAV
jgi:phytoene desaturase